MSRSLEKLNPQETRNNPLNNSSSKMQYSFSKSKRFNGQSVKQQTSIFSEAPFYNIKDQLSKRTTSFGYGNKTKFEDKRILPPPNAYKISSQFQNKKHGSTFGLGRQRVRNQSMFIKSTVPGPGAYNPKEIKHEPNIQLKSRVPDHSLDEKIRVPGPGTYRQVDIIGKGGRYSSSKYSNCLCPIISKAIERVRTEETPAPNSYNPLLLNSRGEKSMRQTQVMRFSESKREGFIQKSDTPGPGQYNIFSQFIK